MAVRDTSSHVAIVIDDAPIDLTFKGVGIGEDALLAIVNDQVYELRTRSCLPNSFAAQSWGILAVWYSTVSNRVGICDLEVSVDGVGPTYFQLIPSECDLRPSGMGGRLGSIQTMNGGNKILLGTPNVELLIIYRNVTTLCELCALSNCENDVVTASPA
jgi:hypothetical protein